MMRGKKILSKHLSNLVDPATTGVNTSDHPYLNKDDLDSSGITVNTFMTYLDFFIKCIPFPQGNDILQGLLMEQGVQGEIKINTKLTFDIDGKEIKYNGVPAVLPGGLVYNASQSIMATGINEWCKTNDCASSIYNGVKPRSKARITSQEYNFINTNIFQINTPHWFRRMKYMGDKSHIVLGIIYALLDFPVVIHTYDRLLYYNRCQTRN